MVTVTPHLSRAIGVLVVSEDETRGVFKSLLEAETAVPARRAGVFAVPSGRDVIVKVCEGVREVRIRKGEGRVRTNGARNAGSDDSSDDSDDDEEDEEEPKEIREKIWKVGTVLAEAAVRAVKKGGKVEVTVNVGADLSVTVTAREVGGKGGVRGQLEKMSIQENGSA